MSINILQSSIDLLIHNLSTVGLQSTNLVTTRPSTCSQLVHLPVHNLSTNVLTTRPSTCSQSSIYLFTTCPPTFSQLVHQYVHNRPSTCSQPVHQRVHNLSINVFTTRPSTCSQHVYQRVHNLSIVTRRDPAGDEWPTPVQHPPPPPPLLITTLRLTGCA